MEHAFERKRVLCCLAGAGTRGLLKQTCWVFLMFDKKFSELSDDPEEALRTHLHGLDIPEERWCEYLSRHLAHLPGWAGFIRWRGDNPGYPAQQQYPIDPLQYLAVRLFYEAAWWTDSANGNGV